MLALKSKHFAFMDIKISLKTLPENLSLLFVIGFVYFYYF
jgi:hypothetical protein